MTNLYHLVDTFDKQVGQGLNNKPSTTIAVFSQILADIRKTSLKEHNHSLTKAQRKAENKLLQKQKQNSNASKRRRKRQKRWQGLRQGGRQTPREEGHPRNHLGRD